MGGIGTEVVLQTLFVANVYHKVIEDAYLRAVANGNGQSALEHILQQCHRLEAHALSAGVRSGDDKDALVGSQHDVEWHDSAVEMGLQQRMARLYPVDVRCWRTQ